MYAGGKARIAKKLVDVVLAREQKINWFWEPFVGGGNSLVEFVRRLPSEVPCFASDSNADIVAMYDAHNKGWHPPTSVSREDYGVIKNLPTPNPLRGFAGTACSFAGKWFGGYAAGRRGDDYVGSGRRWLAKHEAALARVKFAAGAYDSEPFGEHGFPDAPGLIYCDPPYANTTQGYAAKGFNHFEFWDWARQCVSEHGDRVYVSEYTAPPDFVEVAAFDRKTSMSLNGKNTPVVDRLFVHRSQA